MLHTTTLVPMAHLICVAHSRLELADILVSLRKAGVENLMALGGDPPEDPDAGAGELAYAIELVELARAIGGFSIGVAAHPAGHPSLGRPGQRPRLPGGQAGAGRLRGHPVLLRGRRVRGPAWPTWRAAGCRHAGAARDHARDLAVDMGRMAAMGAPRPSGWGPPARRPTRPAAPRRCARRVSELATELCRACSTSGVPGLHFYTFNTSSATREIYAALGLGPQTAP